MTYQDDAVAAFQSLSRDEANWFFCTKGITSRQRAEFPSLIREGRVDARDVMHNVEVIKRLVAAQQVALGIRRELIPMRPTPKAQMKARRPVLRVVK